MEREQQNTEELCQNPWASRGDLPEPDRGGLTFANLLYLAACLSIPFATAGFGLIAVCVFTVLGFQFCGRSRSGVILSLLLSILTFPFFFFGASFGVILFAASVGAASGAYLFTVRRGEFVLLLYPVLAGAATWYLTGNVATAFLPLSILPAALLLGIATTAGERRTTAVLYTVGGFLIPLIAATLWFLHQRSGSIGREALSALLTDWRNRTAGEFLKFRDALLRMAEETGQSTELSELLTDETLNDLTLYLFHLLPAALLLLCEFPAFLAQKMLNAAYLRSGWQCVVMPENEFFTMSVPSCLIFPLALTVSLFGDPLSLPIAVAENVAIILLPGMCVLGFRLVWKKFLTSATGGKLFLILGGMFLFCLNFIYVFYVVGLLAAYDRLMRALRHFAERHGGADGGE